MSHKENPDTFEHMMEKRKKNVSLPRRILGYLFQFGLPLALTVLLVWYIFKKVDFHQMMEILHQGVDYWWVVLACVLSILPHIFRAIRWRLQLRALGIDPPLLAVVCSIFGTYALNLVFPRLGEVWRCTYIAKTEKASFTKVLGSMMADRMSDTLLVILLTAFTFLVASQGMVSFLTKYPVGQGILSFLGNIWTWVGLLGIIILFVLIYKIFRNSKIIIKIRDVAGKFWNGFAVVLKMKGRGKFIGLSFCIWGGYFLQLYITFYAFRFTRELCFEDGTFFGLIPCLVAWILSSIGMAVPSNGGLGPWNIAVMFGLAIYGVTEAQGATFSMFVWSAETVTLIILGIFTMGYISFRKQKK